MAILRDPDQTVFMLWVDGTLVLTTSSGYGLMLIDPTPGSSEPLDTPGPATSRLAAWLLHWRLYLT